VPDDAMDEAVDIIERITRGGDRRVEVLDSRPLEITFQVYDVPEGNYQCTTTIIRRTQ
jgi:hypothetical protein